LFGLKTAGAWLILLPIGIVAWGLLHASGIHATIAGVVLSFTVPVIHRDKSQRGPGLAEVFEKRFRPISAGLAVPLFAFFSAGVALGGLSGLTTALGDGVAVGIMAALVFGKPIGIAGTTWLLSRFTRAQLDPDLKWIDFIGMALLAGIGFTVSLLVAELSFGLGNISNDRAKVAILLASLMAAIVGTALLGTRNKYYRRLEAQERLDLNGDGIPDVYQAKPAENS
jgi:NhaA family Na+:H+ antiporter